MRPVLTRPAAIRPALFTAAALLALPLAACNSGPSVDVKDAKPSEVQQKVADATGAGGGIMVEPGRWEGTMTIHEMNIPGMPAAAQAQMKAHMGTADRTFINCVTPEDVKEQKAFFTGENPADKSCKFEHFTLAGGKIDAAMNCDRGKQGKMAMVMNGTYAPDAYHMDMKSTATGAGPMGGMNMSMTVEAKRVGACRGTKDEL